MSLGTFDFRRLFGHSRNERFVVCVMEFGRILGPFIPRSSLTSAAIQTERSPLSGRQRSHAFAANDKPSLAVLLGYSLYSGFCRPFTSACLTVPAVFVLLTRSALRNSKDAAATATHHAKSPLRLEKLHDEAGSHNFKIVFRPFDISPVICPRITVVSRLRNTSIVSRRPRDVSSPTGWPRS